MSGAVERLRKLDGEATPGPWGWFGHRRNAMHLATTHSGRRFVMDFVRQGMRGAQPRFQLDGLMVKAEELAVLERPYREDIVDIDHPDARLLVEMRNALPALLDVADLAQRVVDSESVGQPSVDVRAMRGLRAALARLSESEVRS